MSIASEITRLQGAKSTLKTKLNAKNDEQHQITNETIDEYGDFVDSIQSSNIIGATSEGESLSLANTKAMPYSNYVVEGKSEQDGEPSPSIPSEIHSVADDVNLLNIGTVTFTLSKTYTDLNIPSGTYTFSTKVTSSDTDYSSSRVYFYNASDSQIAYISLSRNTRTSETFTVNEPITKIVLYASTAYGVSSGDTAIYENIKLQEGTTAKPYSPYNQGTVTIKQRGKNLFNTNWFQARETNGITATIENGQLVLNGTSTGNVYINFNIPSNSFKDSNNYWYIKSDVQLGNLHINETGSTGTGSINITPTTNFTKTVINSYVSTGGYLYVSSGITLNNCKVYVDVRSENIDLINFSYEPYNANDYIFQTSPLRSLPNGVKDSKDTKQHTRVGRVVLDGSETGWFYASGQGFVLTTTNTPFSNRNIDVYKGFCNRFSFNENSTTWTGLYKCGFNSGNAFWIMDNGNIATSVEDFKTWLSNNPTEVLYELAEEVIEPLTQNQATTMLDIIKTGSYEGTTNIYTDEDVKPTIGVGYYKKG